MSNWFVAPCIEKLFSEINTAWPHRSKAVDGTIGDASHAARQSEHNPNANPSDDVTDGMVTAADIDKDGIDVDFVLSKLINADRVWYVIWDRHIYSRTYNWAKNPYNGSDPHTSHIHVSMVQHNKLLNDTSPWGIAAGRGTPNPAPVPTPQTPYQRLASIAHRRLVKIRNLSRRLKG